MRRQRAEQGLRDGRRFCLPWDGEERNICVGSGWEEKEGRRVGGFRNDALHTHTHTKFLL